MNSFKKKKMKLLSCGNMFSLVSLSKSKFFTSVVRVALVSHSCCLCCTRVSLVSLVLHSCRIRVAHVVLVLLVSGTRVVNQTRSGKTCALLNSVQKFIEIQGWLLLTFFICLHNQLSSFSSIVVQMSEKRKT